MPSDELAPTSISANAEGPWKVRWLTGLAGKDFKLAPATAPDGTLIFEERAPDGIFTWIVMFVVAAISLYVLVYDLRFWRAWIPPMRLEPVVLSIVTFALLLVSPYRFFRIASRRKQLQVDSRAGTARIVEDWPRKTDVSARLVETQFLIRRLNVTSRRFPWSGYCLVAIVGDAWFVLSAGQVMSGAAASLLPPELEAIGIEPIIDDSCTIKTRRAI
jgi:hypothetical protein